jgi:outer membrane protein assembly factor BamB
MTSEDPSWPQHARDARNSRWVPSRWPGYRRGPALAFELPDAVSPPVVADGLVAYTGDSSVSLEGGYRTVVELTVRKLAAGGLLWQQWLYPRSEPEALTPVIVDDVVCVALDDLLTGFDVRTGQERWTLEGSPFADPLAGDAETLASDAPTVVGHTAFVRGYGMRLHGVDVQRGVIRWSRRPDRYGDAGVVDGTPVVDGTVVVACDDGLVIALDAASGRHRWPAVTGPRLELAPCAAEDVVVVAAEDRVYGIDLATGERRWRYRLGEAVHGGLACTDRSVVVSGQSSAHLLSVEDGRPRWTCRVRGVLGAPTIAGDVVVMPAATPPRVHGVGLDRGDRLWTVGLGADPESEAVVVGRRLLITAGGGVKVFSFGEG